jgi:hypothetical protein
VIIAAFVAVALGVLLLTAYLINHVPLDLWHVLAVQLLAAVVTVVFLTELARVHGRRAARTTTKTTGDTHASR